MTQRSSAVPQTSGDATVSNNVLTVVGIGGLPIQNMGTAKGVFFVDANGLQVQCLPFGGDITGTPDNVTIVSINGLPIVNTSIIAGRIHARQ